MLGLLYNPSLSSVLTIKTRSSGITDHFEKLDQFWIEPSLRGQFAFMWMNAWAKRQTPFCSVRFEGRDLWGGIKLRQDIGKSKQDSMSAWMRVTVCITLRACSADSITDIFDCVPFRSLAPRDLSQYSASIHFDDIKGLDSPITGTLLNWVVAH